MYPSTIVAIGLSAGGLIPLTTFFDHTPLDNTAYIVLSHLLPSYHSELRSILARHSNMEIIIASNNLYVHPNVVYVMPENVYMTIESNRLILHPRLNKYPNTAIDIFFNGLSENLTSNSYGIVLSGMGNDGTKGIQALKRSGGTIMAQTPSSCEHSSMPLNAIESGAVDYILMVEEMPHQIAVCNSLASE